MTLVICEYAKNGWCDNRLCPHYSLHEKLINGDCEYNKCYYVKRKMECVVVFQKEEANGKPRK